MYIDGGNNPALAADLASAAYLDEWDPKFPAALREVRASHVAAWWLFPDAKGASAMLCHAVLCYVVLCYAMPMPCQCHANAMPCYAMPCYAMLR